AWFFSKCSLILQLLYQKSTVSACLIHENISLKIHKNEVSYISRYSGEEAIPMCEAVVTREHHQTRQIEYRTQAESWTQNKDGALRTSEEDAKAIVRRLDQSKRGPAVYSYDYTHDEE